MKIKRAGAEARRIGGAAARRPKAQEGQKARKREALGGPATGGPGRTRQGRL